MKEVGRLFVFTRLFPFVEAVADHQASIIFKSVTEGWFLVDRFASSVEALKRNSRVFRPMRNEAPAHVYDFPRPSGSAPHDCRALTDRYIVIGVHPRCLRYTEDVSYLFGCAMNYVSSAHNEAVTYLGFDIKASRSVERWMADRVLDAFVVFAADLSGRGHSDSVLFCPHY